MNRTSTEGDNFVAYATTLAAAGKAYLLGQAENDRTLSDGLAGLDYDYATGMSGPAESWQNGLVTSQTAYLDSLSQAAETNRSGSTTAVNDFRSDDLAAAADAVNGMESPLGDTPWSQYQGDLADTVSTWWNTDGTAAHNTWTGEINLASDTFSTDYVNTINTQLTAASGADRLLSDDLSEAIRDLQLELSEAGEGFAISIANPVESYQIAMAGASRDLQLALAEAEVLLAEGDQQGYDDAVAAANEAYDHAVNGYEDTGGNHVDGIRDTLTSAIDSIANAADSTLSSAISSFETLTAELRHDWQDTISDILESVSNNEAISNRDFTIAASAADRDLVIANATSFSTDIDSLATNNNSPWASYDSDKTDAQADFLEEFANATHARTVADANAGATHSQAVANAKNARDSSNADAERDREQDEATARHDRRETESTTSNEDHDYYSLLNFVDNGPASKETLQNLPDEHKGLTADEIFALLAKEIED